MTTKYEHKNIETTMNAISLARVITVSLVKESKVWNLVKHRQGCLKFLICLIFLIVITKTYASEDAIRQEFAGFTHGKRTSIGECKSNKSLIFSFSKSQYFDPNVYEIQIIKHGNDTVLMGIHTFYGKIFNKKRTRKVDTTIFKTDFKIALTHIRRQFEIFRQDSTKWMTLDGPNFNYCYCELPSNSKKSRNNYSVGFGLLYDDTPFARAFSDSVFIVLSQFNQKIPFIESMENRRATEDTIPDQLNLDRKN